MFASKKWCAEPIAQPCRLTRSQFKVTGLSLEFCVRSVSPLPLGGFSLNFGQMFTSFGQCAEPITQPCRLKVKPQLKVTRLSLEFGVSSISLLPLEGFSLNLGQMFASVRWYAEPVTQLCWLKVKVTIEGHQFEPWILRPLHCHSDSLVIISWPRWLSWMRRLTGDQEVAGSTPAEVGNSLLWRLIMKYFLQSFSPFRWFK